MARLGLVFEIPLSGGRKAFGQFIRKDKMGPMIQVFKLIATEIPDINLILESGQMFAPIFTGLGAALKEGFWKAIGVAKIKDFEYPGFLSTMHNDKTGKAGVWFYYDGEKDIRLGEKVPQKYKDKEFLIVWSASDVTHRIETGEYPFPYRELIHNNQYTPRN